MIDESNLPKHIAIIMDGNGRWAQSQGKNRLFGHRNGTEAVHKVVEAAARLQIEHLTLYAFSTENWNRPKLEVSTLMDLLGCSRRDYRSRHSEYLFLNSPQTVGKYSLLFPLQLGLKSPLRYRIFE